MTTAALILAVWSVLAGLVCAFVAGASRRTQVVPAEAPLPIWLELFERERDAAPAQAPAATPAAAPSAVPTGTPAAI